MNPSHDVRWHHRDVYLWEINNDGQGWLATDCCSAFGGSRDMIRLDEDFEAWAEILCAHERAHDTGGECADLSGFDWNDFNAKGLALAKRLNVSWGLIIISNIPNVSWINRIKLWCGSRLRWS